MKDQFQEFYTPKKSEFKALWADAIFILDTNVLLSLYRFPPKTQTKLFGALKKLKKRLWIPHQVALEFHRKRIGVICAQEKTYKDMLEKLANFEEAYAKHPFLHDKTIAKAIKADCDNIREQIKKLEASRPKWLEEDNVLENIEKLFEEKIGDAYDGDKLKSIYAEGNERFDKEIPPGYKDQDKDKSDKSKTRKYGDLIIWNQIIDKAIAEKKPIVFVTDEQKEDWWWKEGGRNVGARYELKKEMKDKAGVLLHMYQSDQFVEHSQEHLNTKFGQDLISEIKKAREDFAKNNNDNEKLAQSSEASLSGLSEESSNNPSFGVASVVGSSAEVKTGDDNSISTEEIPELADGETPATL